MIERDFELIERFFQLDLDEKELTDFKIRLEKDKTFSTNVDKYQLANKTAHELFLPGYQDIVAQQKVAIKNMNPSAEVKNMRISKWWLSIAASISVLLVAAYFLMTPQQSSLEQLQNSTSLIAEQSFNVDALNNFGTRSTTQNKVNPIVEAYQKKEFDKVVDLSSSYAQQADILLLRGIAFHKSGKSSEAIQNLKALINLKSGQKDAALWWLISIHLEQGERKEAKEYLQQIVDGKYPSATKAKDILREM